ncbi:hypothetical protein GTQ40_04590 [Flavobacteriaceae bacterium R38]|nr:hypothetical protein [Flavobacteriaceae bacterium R38]
MKAILYKSVILLFFIPALAIANGGWKGKYTKEKKINKEFSVNANALLKVKNSYGNLYVTSWNENRVVIEVHIQTNGNNEEKVQRKLDEIDVQFNASNSVVDARTIFNRNKSRSWWGSRNNNVNMKINYTIKVPVSNSVNLNNDYGHINLDKIEGRAELRCDYGKMVIGELLGDDNYLAFDYTRKSTLDYIKSGKINADYSGFEIGKAGDLEINADYTNSKIRSVNNITYSADYGNLTIDKANNIQGNGDYITTKIGVVNGNVDITADYGTVKIEELTSNAGNVQIRSDYTSIKIGYQTSYSFNFEVTLGYAGFKGGEGFEYDIKRIKSRDKYYKGYNGSKNSGKNISIKADYGSVTFYQK